MGVLVLFVLVVVLAELLVVRFVLVVVLAELLVRFVLVVVLAELLVRFELVVVLTELLVVQCVLVVLQVLLLPFWWSFRGFRSLSCNWYRIVLFDCGPSVFEVVCGPVFLFFVEVVFFSKLQKLLSFVLTFPYVIAGGGAPTVSFFCNIKYLVTS